MSGNPLSSAGASPPASKIQHIDIYDGVSRAHWAGVLGVSDERLRKAVRLVGTRVSSVSAYLAK